MSIPQPPIPESRRIRTDPYHWRRFRRLMLVMAVAAFGTAAVAVAWMRADGVPFHLHMVIALAGGIVIALLLAGALMGLAFLSNRSGHDETIGNSED